MSKAKLQPENGWQNFLVVAITTTRNPYKYESELQEQLQTDYTVEPV